jgi:hypothetical protein
MNELFQITVGFAIGFALNITTHMAIDWFRGRKE